VAVRPGPLDRGRNAVVVRVVAVVRVVVDAAGVEGPGSDDVS